MQTKRGRRVFRTTRVKPFVKSAMEADHLKCANDDQELMLEKNEDSSKNPGNEAYVSTANNRVKMSRSAKVSKEFKDTLIEELHGLLRNVTMIPVTRDEVPDGDRVFGSRFVDEIKVISEGFRRRNSRLVAQNYSDSDASTIATESPTV